jgi:hypothetical protein
VAGTVDWVRGVLTVQVSRDLDPSAPSLLRAKGDAETAVDARLPDLLDLAVAPVTADSSHTLGDWMASDPAVFARVSSLARGAPRTEMYLTPDFSTLVEKFEIPFFGPNGVASPLFPSRATPVRRILTDAPTRVYTGLVVFAMGMLPEAGTLRMLRARPALFPRIWDEQMNLVFDKSQCAPESLARWGMVGYSQNIDDPAIYLRVGELPLRVAARAVFGDTATDLVISVEGARQLRALQENLAILREGRVVIVYEKLGDN